MKKCPFCAEEIQDEAIKCKHCGSDLTSPPTPPPSAPPLVTQKKSTRQASLERQKGCLIGILLLAAIIIAIVKIDKFLDYFHTPTSTTKGNSKSATQPGCPAGSAAVCLEVAKNFQKMGSFDTAKSNYNDLIRCYPNTPEAQVAKETLGQWEEIVKVATQAGKNADEETRKAAEKAEKAFWQSKAGKICKSHSEWSREDCKRLADRKIWIGMSYDMLVYLRGKPDHVNTSNFGSGNEYQYCWDDREPSCFYDKDGDGLMDAYN